MVSSWHEVFCDAVYCVMLYVCNDSTGKNAMSEYQVNVDLD